MKSDDIVTPAPTVTIPAVTFKLPALIATLAPKSEVELASIAPLNVATPDTAISLNVENPAVLIPGTPVADDGRLVKFAPEP